MSTPLAITGSTGNLGGRVARLLAEAGVEQRLLVREPARAPALPGCATAQMAYHDRHAVRRALDGVETVFMVSASESPTRVQEQLTFVDAASEAGVQHLVYVSFFAAAPDATFLLARDHYVTEEHVRAMASAHGTEWTFLRDNLYADFLPRLAGDDGVIRGPAGDGRVAAVAQDDIAAVAAAVLADPAAHRHRTYSLTGPESLTLTEVASVMSRVTGRSYSFEDETLKQAYESRSTYGAPDWQVDAWVSTYTAIAAGELAEVTDDVLRITGRPSTSLEQLLAPPAR